MKTAALRQRLISLVPLLGRGLGLALGLIAALAVFFRFYGLGSRSLWTDEAWVALAILKPTAAAALAAGQSTPPFYLLTLWGLAQLFGGSEWVLRSLSLLFSVGTLALFWPLARALAPRAGALLGFAAVALSPIMVYFAKELKQYSGDAFFAVLILWLAERLRGRQGVKGWVPLALAGLVGLGFSHTVVFILPVAAAVLWCSLPSGQRPRVAILSAAWTLALTGFFLLFFRQQADPELLAYWAQDFPNFSGLAPFLLWLGSALYRYFWFFLGQWGIYWGPPLLIVGAAVLARRGSRRALAYLGGPMLLAFGAAALHRYPFMAHYGGNRLMLFSAPLLYLTVAVGLAASLAWLWQRRQRLASVALAALIFVALNPMGLVKENLLSSSNLEEIQPLVAQLESLVQPQDLVYVYYFATDPFKYYYRGPLQQVCFGKSCDETGLRLPAAGTAARRLWLIASHIPPMDDLREFAADLLGPHWQETACYTQEGAVLFRFDRQGKAVAAKKAPPRP